MNIHEYQSKELLARHGINVPAGVVAASRKEAGRAARDLGGKVVVKAQVHAGGRGKGGGIKIANNAEEAERLAETMLGSRLVTPQTGSDGAPVDAVLIEQAVEIEQELYLSILVDSGVGKLVLVASSRGGMEIEKLAVEKPEAILRTEVSPLLGLMPYQARDIADGLKVAPTLRKPLSGTIINLYKLFVANDCALVEINPLVVTKDGQIMAADAKLNIDDDALFRHGDLKEWRDLQQIEPLERRATRADLSYVKLDGGQVGCVVNGAGLAMATMDITGTVGATPANFLDVGGSANLERVTEAFSIVLADKDVKVILVNLFAGIARADIVAQGLLAATESVDECPPVVVAMRGTNAEAGVSMLQESSLPIHIADNLTDATDTLRRVMQELS